MRERASRELVSQALMLAASLFALAQPGVVSGQSATNAVAASRTNCFCALPETPTNRSWSFSVNVSGYLVPDSRDYVQPSFSADHDWLHLEARYNYESLETGSVWAGYNLEGGDESKLAWELKPLFGGVFGDTAGIAPGYKGSLTWRKKLVLYSEGEYVVNTRDTAQSYFYSWSELSLAPIPCFRFGLVSQRTRVYKSDFDVQRGFLAGFSCRNVTFTTYVFNPDKSKPTFVLATEVDF